MKIQLQRRGTSQTAQGHLESGSHIEIGYHHGLKYWFVEVTDYVETDGYERVAGTDHIRLNSDSLEEAIIDAEKTLNVEFSPFIEAYCYPCTEGDKYITCAVYEPYSNTIRHAITNVCLVVFHNDIGTPLPHVIKGEEGAEMYQHDPANKKYTKQIIEAIGYYNANVGAHGKGEKRKAWLAWLIGEYIKKTGEKTVALNDIIKKQAVTA